jgi:hypothetical protein
MVMKQCTTTNLTLLAAPWRELSIFDIAANLSDERYQGEYYGK